MFSVPQVQPPDVAKVGLHLLVNELIAFGRNGRTHGGVTTTCKTPNRTGLVAAAEWSAMEVRRMPVSGSLPP